MFGLAIFSSFYCKTRKVALQVYQRNFYVYVNHGPWGLYFQAAFFTLKRGKIGQNSGFHFFYKFSAGFTWNLFCFWYTYRFLNINGCKLIGTKCVEYVSMGPPGLNLIRANGSYGTKFVWDISWRLLGPFSWLKKQKPYESPWTPDVQWLDHFPLMSPGAWKGPLGPKSYAA